MVFRDPELSFAVAQTIDGAYRDSLDTGFVVRNYAAFGATPTDTSVPFYHGVPDRAGNYIVPTLNCQTARSVHRIQNFDSHVEGHIYAQPLYWRPPGPEPSLVIAATESDPFYGLNAKTGQVVWRTALGQRREVGAALRQHRSAGHHGNAGHRCW